MTASRWTKGPPQRILLATDLSARCDRALDRAASLAQGWHAELVALHVLEQPEEFYATELERRLPSWRRPPDRLHLVEEQLRRDAMEVAGNVTVVLEQGDPAEAILRVAAERACDLIVTGMARNETLGRFWLGRTVDRLLTTSPVPLLVVRQRVRRLYAHIVVATDMSDSSLHALQATMTLFPDQPLTVFHAYKAPLAGRAPDPVRFQEEYGKVARDDVVAWLDAAGLSGAAARHLAPLVEPGDPGQLLRQYVRDRAVDLVVVGTHGRSGVFSVLLGSTAREIVSSTPCDTLVVGRRRDIAPSAG